MSKSILVIDTPVNCTQCPCFLEVATDCCGITGKEVKANEKAEFCPLKELGDEEQIQGKEIIDVLRVIQCDVDETKVLTVALKDCELVEPRTNADKIRSMSVDELANFILSIDIDECSGITTIGDTEVFSSLSDVKEWLEREVEK